MQFPVFIELNRSRILALLLVQFHALAAGFVLVLPWPLPIRGLVLLLVAVSVRRALRRPAVTGLRIGGPRDLQGRFADRSQVDLCVLPDSAVFARLIVLRLRVKDGKRIHNLALLPDQMSGEQFRLLRLWLRWQADARENAEHSF